MFGYKIDNMLEYNIDLVAVLFDVKFLNFKYTCWPSDSQCNKICLVKMCSNNLLVIMCY